MVQGSAKHSSREIMLLTQQNKGMQAEIDKLEKKLKQQKAESKAEMDELKKSGDYSTLKERMEEQEKDINELVKRLGKQEDEAHALREKNKALEAENEDLTVISNECDDNYQRSKQQIITLKQTIGRRDSTIERLKAELEAAGAPKKEDRSPDDIPVHNQTIMKLLEELRIRTSEMRESILDAQDKILTKKKRRF